MAGNPRDRQCRFGVAIEERASVPVRSAPARLWKNVVKVSSTSASVLACRNPYKLAEPREFDSPGITQPAHTGVFLRVLGEFAVEPRADRKPVPEPDLHASRRN